MTTKDVSPDLPEFGGEMTNFDFSIDSGVEEALRARTHICRYAGWNFNGIVWFDGEDFVCQPWTYHYPNELVSAKTLKDLMHSVSAKYGYE